MLNPATYISLATIRLECVGPGVRSFGTGYFYKFKLPENQHIVPVILTNKHVIEGATEIHAVLKLIPSGTEILETGHAEGEIDFPFTLNLQNLSVPHPDADIDLCAIFCAPVLNALPAGFQLKNAFITREWHLSDAEAAYFRPIEPIIMIGYPNGLWDQVNNRPIARRGTTASHALRRWNGQRQFVIDAACFPGSSGSPVFMFEDGMYRSDANTYTPGTRIKYLGTLWGGPTFSAEGRLEARTIPTAVQAVPVINTMMNLGFVVHADAADDLRDAIQRIVQLAAATP